MLLKKRIPMHNLTTSHIIILKDKDKSDEIAQCTLKDDRLFVRFKNSPKTFTYTKPNFVIFPKAKNSKVFAYFCQIAPIIRKKTAMRPLANSPKNTIKSHISLEIAHFLTISIHPKPPLNPSKIQITPPKQSPHNTTKQARYSLPLDSIFPNTKPCKTPSLIK